MPTLHNKVFDSGLDYLDANTTGLFICSAQPTTYTEAITTFALGTKATPPINAPSDRGGGGREVVIPAITDGSVTGTGTATHWALVNSALSELLAESTLDASQAVTSGNTFSTAQFAIGIPDPA